MMKTVSTAIDAVTDQLEKFSGPIDRVGHTVERAYKLNQV